MPFITRNATTDDTLIRAVILSAFRKFALDLGFDVEIEREVAAAGFAGASFVHRLRAMLSAGAFIFARQEVNLHFDCVAVYDNSAVKDERLPRVLLVTSPRKERLDGRVSRFPEVRWFRARSTSMLPTWSAGPRW